MFQLAKTSLASLLCATALCVFGCKAKQEATPTPVNATLSKPGTAPMGTMPAIDNAAAGSGSAAVTLEEWEDCEAAAVAHQTWVGQRIATDAGRTLATKQALEIQKLCAYGKWPKGTVTCFDDATSGTALDKCAEKLSEEQKKAVSDLFTEILNATKNAAVGSGSAS